MIPTYSIGPAGTKIGKTGCRDGPWGVPHFRGGKGYRVESTYSGVCFRDGLRPSLGREGLARET